MSKEVAALLLATLGAITNQRKGSEGKPSPHWLNQDWEFNDGAEGQRILPAKSDV